MAPSTPTNPMAPVGLDQPHGAPLTPTKPYTPPYIPTDPHGPHCSGFGQPHPNPAKPRRPPGGHRAGGGAPEASGMGWVTQWAQDRARAPPLTHPPRCAGPPSTLPTPAQTAPELRRAGIVLRERAGSAPGTIHHPPSSRAPAAGVCGRGAPNTAAHGLGKLLVPSRALLRFPLIAS